MRLSTELEISKISNQTIANVPANVTEPDVLKRFLNRLIEELDIVLGYRGSEEYATTAELAAVSASSTDANAESTVTLDSIASDVAANEEEIETLSDSIDGLDTTINDNTQGISDINDELASTVLSATYHDFDNVAWATLEGNSEFNTLGSNLSNAPYAPVGAETYYNFINSVVTANAGVVQVLRAYSTTTLVPTTYFRIGDDWTKAVALGWT